jgi:hypothetical protein
MERSRLAWVALFAASALAAPSAHALDKQGSSHGGSIAADEEGFGIAGALSSGVALYNPTFAARPDNTGLAFLRYAAHVDVDLIGRRLSIPLDVNVFSDRTRRGAGKAAPSELDVMGGVTSAWKVGSVGLEIGSRFQHERPVDRGRFTQTFVDTRARLLYSLAEVAPSVGDALGGGDVSGWLTLGWFTINRSYAARPDLTGLAFLRYAVNTKISFWGSRLALGLDATFFTDRTSRNWFRPSELDLTPELIYRLEPVEFHLAYERDMPVDRGGLVQQFVYFLAVWEFSLFTPKEPLDQRTNILSP